MRRISHSQVRHIKEEMLAEQGGVCAICTTPIAGDNACLDHDHKSGYLRAVLCRNCNRGEGKVKTVATSCKRQFDQIWWLKRLLAYLEEHSDTVPSHGLIHPTHRTLDEKRLRANKKARERRAKKA